ncbi:MAG: hypothetical protein KAH01_01085 [Caldisericia bacterium]|nr:hypothetical protein [Caldisericia bacterium]
MKNNVNKLLGLTLAGVLCFSCLVGCGDKTTTEPNNDNNQQEQETGNLPEDQTATIVNCGFVDVKPTLDGIENEEVWANMEYTQIELESSKFIDVKSYYDNDNVYFLFNWISEMTNEPTDSTAGHWYTKEDGTWTWDSTMDTFSIAWDLCDLPDFAETGCTPLCHDASNVLNNRYMGTEITGDIIELWVWSPAVSGMKGIMASYLWTNVESDIDIDAENFDNKITWEKLPGEYGFVYNRAEDANEPAEGGENAPLYIVNDKQPSGDAALVSAVGLFEFGGYILEIARPRNPSALDLTHFEVSDDGYADFLFAPNYHTLGQRDDHFTPDTASTLRMVGKTITD